ncbi:hypothetical protein ACGFNU_49335 [Spirillospora sp. NPDC048911]|uniref:hypothetical protein n=1 Tax=Spirillospora sp. NPDC048911 TaxID=3364527 RepID=UPI003717E054
MSGFIVGVISSLAASVVTVASGWVFSQRIRNRLVVLLSSITGLGVARTYPSQREANADLHRALEKARWVKVLVSRGNELTRDSFQDVWRAAGGRIESVQILLPDPESGTDSWLGDREAEMRRLDPGMENGLLAEQIQANVRYLAARVGDNEAVQLRLYDLPHVCRVILTDKLAYLTLYGPDEHGRNSPCVVCRSPGLMYDFVSRIFTTAWSRADSLQGGFHA